MMSPIIVIPLKLKQYNEYLISTVDTDNLVLQHQGISSHSAEYAFMHFLALKGLMYHMNWQNLL